MALDLEKFKKEYNQKMDETLAEDFKKWWDELEVKRGKEKKIRKMINEE